MHANINESAKRRYISYRTVDNHTNRLVFKARINVFFLRVQLRDQTVKRAAELCKADLATNLVFEFTELQGFIGADYARVSGEVKEVQDGIREHYFPLNAESETAKSVEGQVVGIADKIDTICAVFAAGKKPTGSSDPLGVRRAALGIIKTILEHDLKIDLSQLISEALNQQSIHPPS